MTDFEYMNLKVGDMTLEEMTSITFLGWVAKKLNGTEVGGMGGNPTLNELSMMVRTPPMGRMTAENKVEVIKKLEKLGIAI
jgi:hypothetical protein